MTALLGLWVVAQPWVLGYRNSTGALWASVVAGLPVILFSLWRNPRRTAQQS